MTLARQDGYTVTVTVYRNGNTFSEVISKELKLVKSQHLGSVIRSLRLSGEHSALPLGFIFRVDISPPMSVDESIGA